MPLSVLCGKAFECMYDAAMPLNVLCCHACLFCLFLFLFFVSRSGDLTVVTTFLPIHSPFPVVAGFEAEIEKPLDASVIACGLHMKRLSDTLDPNPNLTLTLTT